MNTQPRRKWHPQRWLLLLAASLLAYAGWTQYAFRSALKEAKALGWDVYYTDQSKLIQRNWKAAFQRETWTDGVKALRLPTNKAIEQHLALIHRLNPKGVNIDKDTQLHTLSAFTNLSSLRHIGLTGCSELTDVNALKNLPTLHELRLIDCTGLTDVDALQHLTTVNLINLNGCTGLSSVDALANLSTLQFLGLSGCTRLTNVDALKRLTSLRHIDLTRCSGLINLDGLKTLPALRLVVLSGCTGLTKESIEALKAALPNTTILTD